MLTHEEVEHRSFGMAELIEEPAPHSIAASGGVSYQQLTRALLSPAV